MKIINDKDSFVEKKLHTTSRETGKNGEQMHFFEAYSWQLCTPYARLLTILCTRVYKIPIQFAFYIYFIKFY